MPREKVKSYLKSFLSDERVSGNHPINYLRKANFLKIQQKGNSQKDILLLVDEILNNEFGIRINECGGSDNFIYLDDCVFTGNRFRYDVVQWIEKNIFNNGSKIVTYHIAQHINGYNYALKHIRKSAEKRKNEVSSWYHMEININNRREYGKVPEILWPFNFTGDKDVDYYYNRIKDKCEKNNWIDNCYRKHTCEEKILFTSPNTRDIVERAFLKVGAKLVNAAMNPAESMRLLGFEKLESLGLGSLFITYRNISNNCPLALWYGDPNEIDGPLSMWYPLLIRKSFDYNFNIDLEALF